MEWASDSFDGYHIDAMHTNKIVMLTIGGHIKATLHNARHNSIAVAAAAVCRDCCDWY